MGIKKLGTAHFASYSDVVRYYAQQHIDERQVRYKIENQSICLGAPHLKDDETLECVDGRFFIIVRD